MSPMSPNGVTRVSGLNRPHGRTGRGKDPFEGVWAEILGWLRKEPDATAKVLMDRLQEQFPDGQLRTLQRRIRDWRRVMATTLVGHGLGSGPAAELPVIGTGQAG